MVNRSRGISGQDQFDNGGTNEGENGSALSCCLYDKNSTMIDLDICQPPWPQPSEAVRHDNSLFESPVDILREISIQKRPTRHFVPEGTCIRRTLTPEGRELSYIWKKDYQPTRADQNKHADTIL
jgi:hypothetical protein